MPDKRNVNTTGAHATPPIPDHPDCALTEIQAALLLGVSVRTVQKFRYVGGGPPFMRIGRAIRYRRRVLLDWMDAATLDHTSQGDAT